MTKQIETPWGEIGLITFKRTYARPLKGGGTEEFHETVERELQALDKQLKLRLTDQEQDFYRNMRLSLKGSVAGRFMWQLGTKTVDRLGLASLQNCFSRDTKFITSLGIKSFEDFDSGDQVIVKGKNSWKEATVKNFGKQEIYELVVKRGSKTKKVIKTTLNHRWNLSNKSNVKTKVLTTGELKNGDILQTTALKTNLHNLSMCNIGVQHGIVFGDGHYNKNAACCAFVPCGDSKEEYKKWFYRGDSEKSEITGLPNTWKEFPSFSMNKHYIYGFLAGYFAADGSVAKNGTLSLSSATKENLEKVKGLFSKLDVYCGDIQLLREVSPFNGEPATLYKMVIFKDNLPKDFLILNKHKERWRNYDSKMFWTVEEVRSTGIEEDVWCVVEPDNEEFTLESGILTKNCSFTVIDDPVRPFTWAMDMLMLGSGVGYSIKKEHVYNLPKLKGKIKIERFDDKSADFIVPDTREGWVKLLGKTLKAHFYSGEGFSYSTQLIRGKGAPISGFGGTASGPEDLCWGIEEIHNILNSRSNKKLRPIDCLDIMNIIGRIVVAGNVRRSAQLAIGDSDDLEYLKAKRWDLGHIPNWRNMSNNSVDCENIEDLPSEFWETYEQGEPYGLVNLRLSRLVGRLGETQYADENVMGYNPSLRAGTKVWTLDGIKPIEELQDKEFLVRNLHGDIVKASCWLSKPKAQLYKIKLSGGHEYYCTAEHKWPIFTPQGWVKAETTELLPGHLLPINKFNTISVGNLGTREDGFFIGWLYGDGGIHIRKDNNRPQLNLIVSKKDDESGVSTVLLSKLNSLKKDASSWSERKGNKELNCSADSVFKWLDLFGVDYSCKKLPSKIWGECSEEFIRGFVDGLFSSDGTVESSYKYAKVALSSSKVELIQDVSELLGFYGIKHGTHHIDSRLNGKLFDRYTLSIASRENIEHFRTTFSLTVKHKQDSLNSISKTDIKPLLGSVYKIESVELTDIEEPVWDINVKDDTHCFQIAHVITGNCAEQSLADKETCCLAEVYLPNITSEKELWEVTKMLYRVNKHSLALPCHLKDTEEIVHKNMRMGIGITGVMMSTPEQLSWLDITYRKLRAYDEEYSKAMGWPKSIKLTTVKPSGSLSLLAGVTPGVHPSPAGPYYIRRIRMASDSNLVDVCRENGYPVEFQRNFDRSVDKSTVVVSFPCKIPEWVKVGKDVDVIDQLETVKFMQRVWSDNSVSVTAYYNKDDISRIKDYLKENWRDNFKTLSFLLYYGHGFDQAPYEEISKEVYDEMVSKTKKITSFNVSEEDISEKEIGCVGGHCPIK